MRNFVTFTSLVACSTLGTGFVSAALQPADTIIHGGPIYTMNAASDIYLKGAVAIRNGSISWVGRYKEINASVNVQNATFIDTKGHAILPGLTDSHIHPLLAGVAALSCNLKAAALTLSEFQAKIKECLDAEPDAGPDDLLTIVGWDRPGFSDKNGRDATILDVDGITTRPIQIKATDGHTALVNHRALALAGIVDSSPDPPGGKFRKDSSGKLTGILEDAAGNIILHKVAKPTLDGLLQAITLSQSVMNAQGITSIVDAAVDIGAHIPAYSALHNAGNLTTRFFGSYLIEDPNNPELIGLLANFTQSRMQNEEKEMVAAPGLSLGACKVYLDGIITYPTNTGAMLEPYFVQDPNNSSNWTQGSTIVEPYVKGANLTYLVDSILKAGFQGHFHADGDGAVRAILDSVEALKYRLPDNSIAIAHAESVDPKDYTRFRDLNFRLIMQYQWAQDSNYYHAKSASSGDTQHAHGDIRMQRLEPWGNLTNAGNNVIYGSDWPVETLDPFLALKIGVTRIGSLTNPNSPSSSDPMFYRRWDNQATITRMTAMRGMTTFGAEWMNATNHIGSLEAGKFADIIITEKDFFDPTIPDSALDDNSVLMTMVGGKIVYTSELGGNSTEPAQSVKRGIKNSIRFPDQLWLPAARVQQAQLEGKSDSVIRNVNDANIQCGLHIHQHN